MNKPERKSVDLDKVPEHTISRLSLYLRGLNYLEEQGVLTVSSEALARHFGLNAAQIRKDLAYFGDFGVRGVGYNVIELREHLRDILGLNRNWRVALFGLGNLGRALLSYRGFSKAGFNIAVVFEASPEIVAQGEIHGIPIRPIDQAKQLLPELGVQMAILTVPATAAQEVANSVVEAGVGAILNFAPLPLQLPPEIKVRSVDLTVNLENLSYFLHSS